ncbi:GGDEF domain-containing protein [Ferrimonas gelatinilytica]|uniref:diguanylate cyclase n=1 Tax=Ferrimonas gelatinilytica TaxID=1255257 RepID=A0ABP9RVI4_9GAMM
MSAPVLAIRHHATQALLLILAFSQLWLMFIAPSYGSSPWPLLITTLLPLALSLLLWFRPGSIPDLYLAATLGVVFALFWWSQGEADLPVFLLLVLAMVPLWVPNPWPLAALMLPPLVVGLAQGQGRLVMVALLLVAVAFYLARHGYRWLKFQELQQRRLRWRLQRHAHREPLTGLASRRYFLNRLDQAVSEARRSKAPLVIALVELDYFSDYRRHYGRHAEERCLRQVARLLMSISRRRSDIVAHCEGGTFALLLPATDRAGAERLCGQVRHALRQLSLPHDASPIHPCVTVSHGLAQWQAGCGASQLIAQAKRNLCNDRLADRANRHLA